MKVYFFHLMPYGELDIAKSDEYNSAWVTIPNDCFDPAVGTKLYNRYIGELELADQLGFDGVRVYCDVLTVEEEACIVDAMDAWPWTPSQSGRYKQVRVCVPVWQVT